MQDEKPKRGGHLRIGLEWEVDIIDPPSSFGGWNTGRVAQQMFESLVEDNLEEENVPYTTIIPELAEKWDVSRDGLSYTFHLHKGISFHDGKPFDAEAVKSNIERLWKEDSLYYYPVAADYNQIALQTLENMEVIDSHTIKFFMKEPFAEFLRYMTQEDVGMSTEN